MITLKLKLIIKINNIIKLSYNIGTSAYLHHTLTQGRLKRGSKLHPSNVVSNPSNVASTLLENFFKNFKSASNFLAKALQCLV